jgi:hypothetical protein
LEEKNLEIDDIEPCELEGKDTVFFSNPKEGPNSDQNLDAPEFDDIEPCEVFELEGKDTVFFSNPKEGPNSDQNLDAPEFDDDEAPSNSKKDTYVKIFKTTIIVFDIIIWTKIIWRLVRGR